MAAVNGVNGHSSPEASGIKVIIVGAGFGGLTAAIECHRQGHNVEIYESFPELKSLGDIISFGPNAGRIFTRWSDGKISERLRALSIDLRKHGFNIHKWTGELIINQPTPEPDPSAPVFNGHRGELHEVVYNYAKEELGIPIYLGQKILRYFEDEGKAGIVLDGDREVSADVVIGCDGVRSKARELVLGMVLQKDEADIEESWSFPGKLEDVYKVFEGWDPLCKTIVEKTPESSVVDWKLVYRDPLPTWVSENGRIALAGDSAHPFLPTSAQGATQAMEDGVVLAICLKRAGKSNIPLALRSYQDIRYERARKVQKTGESTRDMWHKADWDKVKENPKSIQMPREDWIFKFDAEKDAEARFDEVAKQFA
ncbi:MAG: hypothetical protein Q9227_005727 [Pyrenula ochraceoflavens]